MRQAPATRAAVTQLQSYDWPGNVRELRNVIERAVILARGGALEFDLPITGQAAPRLDRVLAAIRRRAARRNPNSSPKSNLNASNATISCWPWKRPIGRSADPIAPRNFWASNPHFTFKDDQSGASRGPKTNHPDGAIFRTHENSVSRGKV